jgi:quercetin dioxygenase-like cupin family protein
MRTEIYPTPALSGQYDLQPFQSLTLAGANRADVGMVRIGAGTRSPAEGLRASAQHEIAYVVSGKARVDTALGSRIVNAGDVLISSPTELHATTALEDTVVFYVLIDPAQRTE